MKYTHNSIVKNKFDIFILSLTLSEFIKIAIKVILKPFLYCVGNSDQSVIMQSLQKNFTQTHTHNYISIQNQP